MQARIKTTGQIIELCPYVYDIDGNDFLLEEVELLDNPNWEQVRIDAAVKLTCALSEKMLGDGYSERQIVKQAVELADVLVDELKKRGQDESKD